VRLKNFQELAVRTESIVDSIETTDLTMDTFEHTLGSLCNVVDVLDQYKKSFFYGKDLDKNLVIEKINAAIFDLENALFSAKDSAAIPVEDQGTVILDVDPRIFHALLGTITEHGEIAEALLNGINSEDGIDLVNVCEELGDSDWYKALFYEATGVDWHDVQAMIIKKLEIRYSGKCFTEEEAASRDLVAERNVLNESIAAAIAEYKLEYKNNCG
jgi:hypothetical protein